MVPSALGGRGDHVTQGSRRLAPSRSTDHQHTKSAQMLKGHYGADACRPRAPNTGVAGGG